ncbi:MAG: NAD(+)/NADH kinase [Anaerolineae bacterium]|nr:NAD(+)/NADH kinase [Anaerolineae bacterium]
MRVSKIAVLAHPLRPATFSVAQKLADNLTASGVATLVYTRWVSEDVEPLIPDCDMVIAIGGDGAMLRAARVCAPYQIPVLGINMGQLGFLTEINTSTEWSGSLERLLTRDWWVEKRMMLHVSIIRGDEVLISDHALNDVVISGSVFGRMIEVPTTIDGHWTTTYYADALVVATATGSTAYALACGGPILPPELKNILIVPAAPHLSMDRPIVLAEGSVVEAKPSSPGRVEIVVTADGRVILPLEAGDVVRVQASEYVSQFVRLRGRNYFYRSLLDRLEPRVRRGDQGRGED